MIRLLQNSRLKIKKAARSEPACLCLVCSVEERVGGSCTDLVGLSAGGLN